MTESSPVDDIFGIEGAGPMPELQGAILLQAMDGDSRILLVQEVEFIITEGGNAAAIVPRPVRR